MKVIYEIKNKENGKRYIGSATYWRKRVASHKHNLRNNKHHNIHLQRAWNKYGENTFEFRVIERHQDDVDIVEIEQSYFDAFSNKESWKNLYNIAEDATAPMSGREMSDEFCNQVSERLTGRERSEQFKKNMSKMMKETGRVEQLYTDKAVENRKEALEEIKGEKSHNAKVSDYQAKKIKFIHALSGLSREEISDEFDISMQSVCFILNEETYSHVNGPTKFQNFKRVTCNQAEEMYKRNQDGDSYGDIAEDYPCSKNTVGRIVRTFRETRR